MKRLRIVFALLFCTVLCHAEDYPYLSFEKADGSVVSVSVSGLSMTFSDGKLVVANDAGNVGELSVAALSRMFFSADAASIAETVSQGSTGREVYTLSGVCVGKYDAAKSLLAGIYVVKEDGKTFKMTVR